MNLNEQTVDERCALMAHVAMLDAQYVIGGYVKREWG